MSAHQTDIPRGSRLFLVNTTNKLAFVFASASLACVGQAAQPPDDNPSQ